jgi:hypothetical protein
MLRGICGLKKKCLGMWSGGRGVDGVDSLIRDFADTLAFDPSFMVLSMRLNNVNELIDLGKRTCR